MAGINDARDIVDVSNRQGWRRWLEENAASAKGAWLIMQKKNSPKKGPSYDEAVEEALAFGWIDSRPRVIDRERYQLLFVPRQAGSTWAKSNKQRVEKLTREGKMSAAGLEKVERARADGSWNLLDDLEALKPPEDLRQAFEANPLAARNFQDYTDSAKKMILWWLLGARRPETRKRRIDRIVEATSNKVKVGDLFWKQKG
jgi:uncharacterized protein YdeI (YjbR/CyaY-like superfamily)